MREFTGKMPRLKVAGQTLYKPAQSKCTWTSQTSHFMREFTGKMPQDRWSTLIYITPALTSTVRTPQCEHTVWGKITREAAKP